MHQKILIIDFGSQYTQLIARRVREMNVFCEMMPFHSAAPNLEGELKGIILSGSPASVHDTQAPRVPDWVYASGLPILGICYGAQYTAQHLGGNVGRSEHREYGRAHLKIQQVGNALLAGLSEGEQVWMSHGDTILHLPDEATAIARTADVEMAAYHVTSKNFWGVQFHPEVTHTLQGALLLSNFVRGICGCIGDWTPATFATETIESLKKQIGTSNVVLGLSGGVDSSVAAALLSRAIGDQLYCIFVDSGLLRKDEYEQVMQSYHTLGLNVVGVNAKDEFYSALNGLTDPELKRKAIGRTFVEVFDREASRIKNVDFLAQGTIYPDVVESAKVAGPVAAIKSHHNVGGLPDHMKLKVVEPLRLLFKDEVRRVGTELGVPPAILKRHPFPGPGLAIRILGEVNAERVDLLQRADAIYIDALKEEGLYDTVWQAGAILLPVKSVGVMGDERTYENAVCLRAVSSVDGMTADWVHLPYDFLARVSNNIINRVRGINRVVYDISSKPPATIEWE